MPSSEGRLVAASGGAKEVLRAPGTGSAALTPEANNNAPSDTALVVFIILLVIESRNLD